MALSAQPVAVSDDFLEPVDLLNPGGSENRKVLILYTGGTMGMKEKEDGSLGLVKGALVERLRLVEELDSKKMPQCFVVEFKTILDSADMNPDDWFKIAGVIHDNYYEYDGFVVIHGTDTLAYTASALSFMLEELAKPVVVTGSQLPFFEPLSDARQNFLGAVVFAGLADICEVCVFFSHRLLRANRTRKVDATALQAFVSPSYPNLAELGTYVDLHHTRLHRPPRGRFRLHRIEETEIMVVWVIPGFSDSFLEPLISQNRIKGIVMLLYGCGNAPSRRDNFLRVLKQLVDSGVVVAACSQCLHGTVDLEKYSVGKAFQDIGVIGACDMTPEATVTKMSYLLSKKLSPEKVRKAMVEDLRGEISSGSSTRFSIREPVTGAGLQSLL